MSVLVVPRSAQKASGRARKSGSFRADIQGLRAVAVVLVVLNHLFGFPSGGFIGVDVFYVISGFLITSLLLREFETTGSISFRGFYARRFRRIAPAAILVLAVTVALAYALWFTPRALQTLMDAISALFFVSNWHFSAIGTNYLASGGLVSPLQHYWSLSVEEQFYAVWPLLLFGLLVLLRGRRKLVAGVIGAAVVLFFCYAVWRTLSAPTPAYFETPVRAWELLLGALIAVTGVLAGSVPAWIRSCGAGLGLLLIVGGALGLSNAVPVPAPGVAFGVVGAALVITVPGPAGPRSVLGNPVAQWLGRISYSLYLWHFPVLQFAQSLFGTSAWVSVASLPVMLGLSELSYRFVERAVLSGHTLRRAAAIINPRRFVRRDLRVGLVAFVAVILLVGVTAKGPLSLGSADALATHIGFSPIRPAATAATAATDTTGTSAANRTSEVKKSVRQASWPAAISAEMNQLYLSQDSPTMACRDPRSLAAIPAVCTADDGPTRVLLIGDSIAMSWGATFQDVAKTNGWDLTAVGYSNCSLVDVPAANRDHDPGFGATCTAHRTALYQWIEQQHPDIVVLSSVGSAMQIATVPAGQTRQATWQAGMNSTLSKLASVPHVVVISDPGELANSALECSRWASPRLCATPRTAGDDHQADAERAAVREHPNAVYIDAVRWFCADGVCPVFVGGTVTRVDTGHLTDAAGLEVAPLLESRLRAAGLATG